MLSQRIIQRHYKTLGTSVKNSPIVPILSGNTFTAYLGPPRTILFISSEAKKHGLTKGIKHMLNGHKKDMKQKKRRT